MFRRKAFLLSTIVVLSVLLYGVYFSTQALPIAAGYGAKVMCSAIFVSARREREITAEDLNFFPLTLASYAIDYEDSAVTCSLFGFAKTRAIYRNGRGATLVNDFTETEIRKQHFRIPMHPSANPDTIAWPMGDKTSGSFPKGIDSLKLITAIDHVFHNTERSFTNLTRALLILYKGQVVAERYADGISKETKLAGWSMTKSITGALVGVLVKKNKLVIDEPAPVPEWNNISDPRHQITLRNLLQQTSGLDFFEVYNRPSHANRMLFCKGDAAGYTASQKLSLKPGTAFRYSSGNSNIISRLCRQVIGEEAYHAFPYENLFFKLGMYHTVMEVDASGTFIGSSFCYATLRDWARFGLLYFNNGRWGNEQLLPVDWVRATTSPSSAATQGEYGFQWWLNAGAKANRTDRKYPELPVEMYYASGFEGQNIFIIPSKGLIIVRLGLTRNQHWGENELVKSVISAVEITHAEEIKR